MIKRLEITGQTRAVQPQRDGLGECEWQFVCKERPMARTKQGGETVLVGGTCRCSGLGRS